MKAILKIITLAAMLIGITGWAGESAPFLLDTTDPLITAPISYNSAWIGGYSSAEVIITDNGTEIKRTIGEGDFIWSATSGKHTLTYTTYIGGVAQEEVYTATVFKDYKYTVQDGKAMIVAAMQTFGSVTIPSEIDGYPVGGVVKGALADCISVTIPVSVSLNNTIDLKHCKILESITMEYAGVDGNTPTKVYLDDELLLASAERGAYTWVPYPAGVHELRCETGSKTLTILVNTLLNNYNDSQSLPNPPGVKDETLSLSVERKEFTNAKRSAGTFSVTSTTGSGTWSASASEEWISLTKTSGSVSDKVSYIIEANASAQSRVGYVYVSGHVHAIVQPGTGATVSPSSLNIGHQGVTQSIAVDTVVDGASWTARSESQWISVTPVSGSGDGNVAIQVAPYYVVGTREGSVTIAGETVSVIQRGRDMELINYSTNCTSAAQSVLVDVSAISDVTWSVVSGADWITVSHAGSGLGSSTVDLSIAENTSYLPRTGTVAIGTETFTVTQEGVSSPSFSIAASTVSVPATATSSKTLKITATPDLPWKITSNCDWLAPLNNYKTGAGTKTIAYSVDANPNLSSRSGKLTFTPDASSGLQSKTLTVTQAAAVSSINSTSASVSAAATTVSVAVTVDPVVNWSVTKSVSWVTIEGSSSRTGAGTVVLRISENTSLTPRNGTVTIAGRTYTIRQEGGTIGISSSTGSVTSNGGTLYINVTGSANLNWSIQNAADWVTIEGDASHIGPATLVIRVEANTGTEDRKCEIIIGGQKLTIEQKAASTSVDEDVLFYGEDVEIGLFSVEAPDYLTWETVTEDDDWIIVTSDSPTTGSGEVEYIVDSIDSGTSRIGIIWVGNTPVYICQSSFSAELSETAKEVSRLSGIGQIAFEVGSGNRWYALSTVPWIRIVNSQGEGDGFVSFEYDENATGGERVGRIIIADKVFTLTQTDVDPSVPSWTISYENLKGASNSNPSRYAEGSSLTFLPLPNVTGYTFAGWTPSSIKASDTGNKTVRANWTANTYTVKFDANGGNGQMADQSMTYDSKTALRANAFTRTGYTFAGWRLEASGSVAYADRAQVSNLTGAPNGVVSLYAVWKEKVENPVITPGDGTIFSSDNCTVTISCSTSDVAIYYSMDGATPSEEERYRYKGQFVITETTTIKAIAVKDGVASECVTAVISKTTMEELVGWEGDTIFDSNWECVEDKTAPNGFALKYELGKDKPDLRAIVTGPGTLTFTYRIPSSEYLHYFNIKISDCNNLNVESLEELELVVGQEWKTESRTVDKAGNWCISLRHFPMDGEMDVWECTCGAWKDFPCECDFPDPAAMGVYIYISEFTWTPATPITYTNLRGATHSNPETYLEGTVVSFANPSEIVDYTFTGWTPAQITADMTGAQTVTANWIWTPRDAMVESSITGGKEISVKAEWVTEELERKFGSGKKQTFIEKFGDNLVLAMSKKTGKKDSAGNELCVWHDYVAGTDPTDVNSVFKAWIEMVDGKPVISWTPDLNNNGDERFYKISGKGELNEDWHYPTNSLDRFFKVDVSIPFDSTISFNVDGGVAIDSISVRVGQPIGVLPEPEREGYTFAGWFTSVEGGEIITPETIVTDDMTIYAKWDKVEPKLYCVIDLSDGTSASTYPVTYLAAEPEGGWTDEYKTTKLVMRKIEAGSFKLGGKYDITLTKPFYMGVFEVTQKQYELVTGNKPSKYQGDARPVETMSWNLIRGESDTYNWPNVKDVDKNSFIGLIRTKTGLVIDLPTESQWEYACRAGTESAYNNGGDAESDLATLGRYKENRYDGRGGYSQHTKVGSYEPNKWGLYDMHGNVWEWCLDWKTSKSPSGTDPEGVTSGTSRARRGGGYGSDAESCISTNRFSYSPSKGGDSQGFRIASTVSEP